MDSNIARNILRTDVLTVLKEDGRINSIVVLVQKRHLERYTKAFGGGKVTVIEFADRIVPAFDKEIGKSFHKILEKQGFKFMLGTKLLKAEQRGETLEELIGKFNNSMALLKIRVK